MIKDRALLSKVSGRNMRSHIFPAVESQINSILYQPCTFFALSLEDWGYTNKACLHRLLKASSKRHGIRPAMVLFMVEI